MSSATVVICAYTLERWDALRGAVASSARQTRRPDQIVVVIDHNDALLARATAELTGVSVLANRSTKGLSGARNTGVAAATGEVVVFLDDDARAEDGWLESLLAPLEDPAVAGVGGWILPEFEGAPAPWFPETYYWILGCSYAGLPASGATIRNPIGASMAIRRCVFDLVGGFTSGIGRIGKVPLGCEETELCIRYGAQRPGDRFVLERASVVRHLVPPARLTWHYFWTRCWAEGLSKAAVSSLVGSRSGLASEREHLARAIPRELLGAVRALPRHPRTAATKIALVVTGALIAGAGLLRGKVSVRRHPITPGGDDLEALKEHWGDGEGTCASAVAPAG